MSKKSSDKPKLALIPHSRVAFCCAMETEAKKIMKQPRKQSNRRNSNSEEVTSLEWEVIQISEQEEDLIHRMHRLVGDRWDLIAGRIPGRTAVEIERFWILKHAS